MKLKKIASLILTGVLAVSMLAGCGNGENGGVPEVSGTSDLASKIIAHLDEETTKDVTVSVSAAMEADLEKAIQNVGYKATALPGAIDQADAIRAAMIKINPDYDKTFDPTDTSEAVVKEDQQMTVVIPINMFFGFGADEDYICEKMAELIDTVWEGLGMPEYQDIAGEDYWYNYTYTADLGVVEVKDAVTGQSTYVFGLTLYRTAAKAEKE